MLSEYQLHKTQYETRLSWTVVVVVLIALGIRYWQTMPPGMSSLQVGGWNDSAAMQVVGAYWGVAHSPGYPLYTLIANLFVRLANFLFPQIEPARWVSLFSGVCAIVSLGFLFDIQRRLRIKSCFAIAAVAILGTRPTFWQYAIMAEVYMLNLSLIMIGVWLALGWKQSRSELPYLIAIGTVFGATIAHHRTGIMAMFVVLLWMIWVRKNDAWKTWFWRLEIMLVASVPMLLLYGYLPLAARIGAGKTRIYADATQPAIFCFMVLSREWWGLVKVPTSFAAFFQSMTHLLQKQAYELGGLSVLLLSLVGLIAGIRRSLLFLSLAATFTGFGVAYRVADLDSMLIPLTAFLVIGLSWCVHFALHLLEQLRLWHAARNVILWLAVTAMVYIPVRALVYPPVNQSSDTVGLDLVEAIRILAEDDIPLTVIAEANTPLAIVQYARARHKLEAVEPLSATDLAGLYPVSADKAEEKQTDAEKQVQSMLRARWESGRRIFISSEVLELNMIPEITKGLSDKSYFIASTNYPDLKILLPATNLPPLRKKPEHSVSVTNPTSLEITGYDYRWIKKRSGVYLRIAIYWTCRQKTNHEYQIILRPTGDLVGVMEEAGFGNLLLGSYPPEQLEPGATLYDTYELRLNALPLVWNTVGLEISYRELDGSARPAQVIQVSLPSLPTEWPE